MKITVEKLTTVALARRACSFTMHSQAESAISLGRQYRCAQSPMRTQT